MATVGLFPSIAGMPLVGNAVTGVFDLESSASEVLSHDSFLSGPSPDHLLGTFVRGPRGRSGGGGSRNADDTIETDDKFKKAIRKVADEIRKEFHEIGQDVNAFKEKGVESLIKDLSDTREDIRHTAAMALGEIDDSRAVEPLIKAMGDENWHVRFCAIISLGEIGDSRAIPHLEESCRDQDKIVREVAEGALKQIRKKVRKK
jgi:HEAT repeat protein